MSNNDDLRDLVKGGEEMDWFSTGQAANYLGVSKKTMRTMADDGTIRSVRTPQGDRRFLRQWLEESRHTGEGISFIRGQETK